MKTVGLRGKKVSRDSAIGEVISIQAKLEELKRENAALRADREDLLAEYTDLRRARPVAPPRAPRPVAKTETIRMCVGDVHGKFMDRAAVDAFLADVRTLDPDEIVLGGDILTCDGWLAKHQPLGFVASCDYTYQEDVKAANWFLDELQKAAPHAKIYFVEGNHEDRVERWIVDQTMANQRDAAFLYSLCSPKTLLRLEERGIPYYKRSEIYGEGLPRGWLKLGNMFFTHSLSYSKNAARDAIMKVAGNVTYFCTHREDAATVVFPEIGLVKAFNPGCLCQMQPIYRNSDPTSWSQGYGVDFINASGRFQRVHIPIWRGESMARAMIERFKS